eukprot:3549946-Rhodomonas_salina.1
MPDTDLAKLYALSGSNTAKPYALSGTSIAKPYAMSCTDITKPYALSGTDVAKTYAMSDLHTAVYFYEKGIEAYSTTTATESSSSDSTTDSTMSKSVVQSHGRLGHLYLSLAMPNQVNCAICLRTCYAMSGTQRRVRGSYAMSGTDMRSTRLLRDVRIQWYQAIHHQLQHLLHQHRTADDRAMSIGYEEARAEGSEIPFRVS